MSTKTRTGLKVGISLPQLFPQGRVDHVHLRDFVRRAEAQLAKAGLDHLVLNPCDDHARQMKMLAEKVVSHL